MSVGRVLIQFGLAALNVTLGYIREQRGENPILQYFVAGFCTLVGLIMLVRLCHRK